MRRRRLGALNAALLLVCSSCAFPTRIAQQPIVHDLEPADLSTYQWDRSSLAAMAPGEVVSWEFASVIRDEIEAQMAVKDYRKVDDGTADMTLDFRVTIQESVSGHASQTTLDPNDESNLYGLRWNFGDGERPVALEKASPAEEVYYYDLGTLHIGLFAADGHLIWHVFARTIIDKHHTTSQPREVLRDTVRKLMARLPHRATTG